MSLLGVIAAKTGRPREALDWSRRAYRAGPNDPAIVGNHAKLMTELGQIEDAVAGHEQLLRLRPSFAEGHVAKGALLHKLGRLTEALASYERALELKPGLAQAHYNKGVALRALNRPNEALASYERALGIQPNHAASHNNRGILLQELGRPLEALASYDRTVALSPNDADAHRNRGAAFQALGRFDEALASFERAMTLNPSDAQNYAHRGSILLELRRLEESLASYDRALALKPDYAEVHLSKGLLLQQLDRPQDALQSLQQSIEARPDHAEGHAALANALMRLHRPEEALVYYARAISIEPARDWLYGYWLHARAQLCDWRDHAADLGRLLDAVSRGRRVVLPFFALALSDSLERQREAATIFVNAHYPNASSLPPCTPREPGGKIRLGYFSADFHEHATTRLAAGLFELHDRTRFELTAFSFGRAQHDAMRERLSRSFDRFVDVRASSDQAVALASRQLGIDIAVDLKGFTEEARPGIFWHRAAPVQVSYLGYPGTMGAPFIDYLIADPVVVPSDSEHDFTEKIVRLPHSYQVNDRLRAIADRDFSRTELGLPPSGFVFCCFNNAFKIEPETFSSWMRILAKTPGSVLWLIADEATAESNLRREAHRRGVDADRLIFAPRLAPAQHLARHRAADLVLDTLPYNAHTTASDALWAGLPVLTLLGESFAGRVAASLLTALGLAELIARTREEYESLALELAASPDRLARLKMILAQNRLSTPLFDTELFTRHLEDAYLQMHERSLRGLEPAHLNVLDRRGSD